MTKKKMAIVCFTPQGKDIAERILEELPNPFLDACWEAEFIYKPVPFKQWMKEHFQELDALLFIGAMGIVVRDMAPCLKSKLTDPAVVVMDEKAQYVISVLSGHLGGANRLSHELAHLLGAIPVITTSSDVNGKIAIDVFAKENNLKITSMKQAKLCASEIVSGYPVEFFCQGEIQGKIPPELTPCEEWIPGEESAKEYMSEQQSSTGQEGTISKEERKETERAFRVVVSPYKRPIEKKELHLIPKAFVLGIGCKKGTREETIEARVREVLEEKKIDLRSVEAIASIDLKQEEEGLLSFGRTRKIPLFFYSGETLRALPGTFTESSFVKSVTGVENVCERAAYQYLLERQKNLSGEKAGNKQKTAEDSMVVPKSGKDGVTVAVMKIDWSVRF